MAQTEPLRLTIDEHLNTSGAYAHPLNVEKTAADTPWSAETELAAQQGEAMRRVVHHTGTALVLAIRELTDAVYALKDR